VADADLLPLDKTARAMCRRLRPGLAEELRRRADSGVTVVAVSHDPDDFHTVCDRILVVVEGRLKQITHDEFHTHLEMAP